MAGAAGPCPLSPTDQVFKLKKLSPCVFPIHTCTRIHRRQVSLAQPGTLAFVQYRVTLTCCDHDSESDDHAHLDVGGSESESESESLTSGVCAHVQSVPSTMMIHGPSNSSAAIQVQLAGDCEWYPDLGSESPAAQGLGSDSDGAFKFELAAPDSDKIRWRAPWSLSVAWVHLSQLRKAGPYATEQPGPRAVHWHDSRPIMMS